MRITVEHRTTYRYPGEVQHTAQYLHLTPATNPSQRVIDWWIDAPGQLTPWRDGYANYCHTLVVERPTTEIVVTARGRVDTDDTTGVLPPDEIGPPLEVYLRPTPLTRSNEAIRSFAEGFRDAVEKDRIDGLHRLMAAIRERVDYVAGTTHAHTTAAETFESRTGVCQDHAHLFISCGRTLGVPTRYVSGYLYDGEHVEPYTASHAWAASFVPDLGWVAFDIANVISATERHIGVAHGLDYNEAAPIRGVRAGGPDFEEMEVAVRLAATDQ